MRREERGLAIRLVSTAVVGGVLAFGGIVAWHNIAAATPQPTVRLTLPSGQSVDTYQDVWGTGGQDAANSGAMIQRLPDNQFEITGTGLPPIRVNGDSLPSGLRMLAQGSEFRYSRTSGNLDSGTVTVTPTMPARQ